MRIGQLVSNLHPISPHSNHGIYSHVGQLSDQFVTQGHDVHVFGSGDSDTNGILHSVQEKSLYTLDIPEDIKRHYTQLLISSCYEYAAELDVIHSHFTLLSSFYTHLVSTPTVISIHSPIRPEIQELLKTFKDLSYISFSHAQRKLMPELNWIANIYHGLETQDYDFNPEGGEYLLYLGRITEEKGVHYAIQTAEALNMPLIIAGRSYPEEGYWQKQIEPHIDGSMVRYVGEADLARKVELFRNAKATLFPTQYQEVFGLVMIESMACGTPVIGWNNGSVPEVIKDGQTGFIVNNVKEMVKAVKSIDKIERKACRTRVERYFSLEKMVSGYLKVYERVIEANKKARKSK